MSESYEEHEWRDIRHVCVVACENSAAPAERADLLGDAGRTSAVVSRRNCGLGRVSSASATAAG